MDKYEVLYNLALEVYRERNQSLQHIQEKASKYFTALTFLLGFSLYYSKWILDALPTNHNLLDWLILIESGVLLSLLIITWFYILRILRVENFTVLPLDKELQTFFIDNRQIDIYFTMSKGIQQAVEANNITHDKKSGFLNISYNLLTIDAVLIIISLILYSIKYFKQYG